MLIEKIGAAAMLEQTAEEMVEAAHACLKYARFIRKENPTAKDFPEIYSNFLEEIADVKISINELHIGNMIDDSRVDEWIKKKEHRISERFSGE